MFSAGKSKNWSQFFQQEKARIGPSVFSRKKQELVLVFCARKSKNWSHVFSGKKQELVPVFSAGKSKNWSQCFQQERARIGPSVFSFQGDDLTTRPRKSRGRAVDTLDCGDVRLTLYLREMEGCKTPCMCRTVAQCTWTLDSIWHGDILFGCFSPFSDFLSCVLSL